MMTIDFCKKCTCGQKRPIVNRTHWLCDEKNKERILSNKDPLEKQKKIKRFIGTSIKQKEILIQLQTIYSEIANERDRICVGCGTTKMLSHSHIVARSRRKDLELEKKNIVYHCLKCHHIWEHGSYDEKIKLFNFNEMVEYIKLVDNEYYNIIISKWQK